MNDLRTTSLDEAIISNHNLLCALANRYGNNNSKDDLYQAGTIGLISAYHNFDSNHGCKFSTYAYPYIVGEMKKYVREDRNIRINRDIIYLKSKIERARELIMQKNKREPTTFELSKYLEIDEKKVIEALEINAYTKSIDEPINVSGKEITIKDIVCEKESLEKLDLICIKEALSGLSDIERYLLNMRYFEGLTQMETASIMGMTQVQVSRMEKRILEKMKLILCS